MRNILSPSNIDILARFAEGNVLLAFDYDGTLAPIHSRPAQVRMRPATRRLLISITRRYPCVIISGRSRDDLTLRVGNIPVWHVSGNHGIEPWGEHPLYPEKVRAWCSRLRRDLADHQGVAVEEKTYSLTVHYRHARSRRRAVAAIAEAIRGLQGARAVPGLEAVSVLPEEAPGKGIALERARQLLACDSAIYVGDDDTDEEAFGAAGPDRLLAIRIGRRRRSRAVYTLGRQTEIDDLLRVLLRCRPLNAAVGVRRHR
jgi:trehalose 6-phosphate phosphatase